MSVAKRYQDELPNIKKNVRNSYEFFRENCERFHMFRRFVFDTSITDEDKTVLDALNKPKLEFNILEAYISRLRGEFSKQEPSVNVMADDGITIDPKVIEVVGDHIRHIIFDANKDGCEYQVYTDALSGGFSVIKVWTEYANSMSMNQVIRFQRVYDPTLCGFDPMARAPHKGDGRYCFELYPKSKEEFSQEYPDIKLGEVSFTRSLEGFNWSYINQHEDVLLICDYYEKKKKRVKIVKLVTGHIITMDEYKKFLEEWEQKGLIEAPPAMAGSPRWTEIETICRYRLIENQVLEYVETDYTELPLVFVDGNSINIRKSMSSRFEQMTRPYVYHARGAQKLKNFAGQTLANELENMVQHKFKIAKESLPDEQEYLSAYTNVQLANTLVYKAFNDNDPTQAVPPPQEIMRVPAPPEVTNTFTLADQMTQTILGSYDASLGINDNQLSGIAIIEGATQSNSAAMPYVVGFLQALSQVANIVVSLIPKYYATPRTIPTFKSDGTRGYQVINDPQNPNSIDLHYDSNSLQVKVEAGVNFAIQKNRALQQIIAMMQASPLFAQFMNSKGLNVLLDNLEIHGIDQLKKLADEFMVETNRQQQMQQQQQQMQMQQAQQAMMNSPDMLRAKTEQMKIQQKAQQDDIQNELNVAKLSIDKQNSDANTMKIVSEIKNQQLEAAVMVQKADAEKTRAAVDLAMKAIDIKHDHEKDNIELHNNMLDKHLERLNNVNL